MKRWFLSVECNIYYVLIMYRCLELFSSSFAISWCRFCKQQGKYPLMGVNDLQFIYSIRETSTYKTIKLSDYACARTVFGITVYIFYSKTCHNCLVLRRCVHTAGKPVLSWKQWDRLAIAKNLINIKYMCFRT